MKRSMASDILLASFGSAILLTPATAMPTDAAPTVMFHSDNIVRVRVKRQRNGAPADARRTIGPPGTGNGAPVSTPGAPAGSGTGNGATGSGAAPSGKS